MSLRTIINKAIRPILRPMRYKTAKLALNYLKLYKKTSIMPNTILYEVRDGQSITDSPRAIFEYLLAHDDKAKYTHIWTVTPSKELEIIMAEYKAYDNVLFVIRNSKEYLTWLVQAEYLINNATFQPFVTIKPEQTYINTWHGTPLKYMGFDIPGKPSGAQNVLRNFAQADYLLMPNQYTTDIFVSSYRLKGLVNGEILEGGYPRIDYTLTGANVILMERLTRLGFKWDQRKKTILYAPTWKGNAISEVRDDVTQMVEELAVLRRQFDEEYNVFIKVHPFLYKAAKQNLELVPYLIPDVIDTNELLAQTDILITDYSSIFFDFLVTGRPIIFYSWDEDLYMEDRGCYIPVEELPGISCYQIEEVAETIANLAEVNSRFAENYRNAQARFVNYDTGLTTARYVDYIFNHNPASEMRIYRPETTKEKILFYPGGMINNGITSSFINLLNNLDYDKYQVTCILGADSNPSQVKNIELLPKEVSLAFNFSDPLLTIKETYLGTWIHGKGLTEKNKKFFPESAYKLEMRRLLGDAHYDFAIDFSGYSLFWTKFILASQADKYLIYLHSDMLADSQRLVNGRAIHYVNLRGLFSAYDRYDRLISVTEVISEINKENLSQYASPEKFVAVQNTIDVAHILGESHTSQSEETPSIRRFTCEGIIHPDLNEIELKSELTSGLAHHTYVLSDSELPEKITIIGELIKNGLTYYKIMANNRYLGWIEEDKIEFLPVQLRQRNEIDRLARINTHADSFAYSEPVGLSTSIPLSKVQRVRNVNVSVKQEAITDSGTSYLLSLKGEKIGWLKSHDLKFYQTDSTLKSKLLASIVLHTNQFFNRKQIKTAVAERVIQRELLTEFGRITRDVRLNSIPAPVVTASATSNKGEYGVKNQVVKVEGLFETITGTYYLVSTGETEGFITTETLSMLTDSSNGVYYEAQVDYYIEFVTKNSSAVPEVIGKLTLNESAMTYNYAEEISYHVVGIAKTRANETYLKVAGVIPETPIWVLAETTQVSQKKGVFNAQGTYISYPSGEEITFVTLGRLSPEKDQAILVNAFAKFYTQTGKGYLYIIGDGPLHAELTAQVVKLGLSERVFLVGHIDEPFRLVRQCEVFVLTSKYEGQSLAIIEALTLGLPVISTDIPACRQVLADGRYGMLSATNDADGIADSMLHYYQEHPAYERFDYEAYNEQAKDDFTTMLTAVKKD